MYLKRLEIQGFKSFANKTILTFDPGITSIVGPNGSGKSNIADAVRWVLGEQSKSLLRSKKAEDVIFVGSSSKKGAPFAQVSVVFDNRDEKLPIDSSEVVFTRKVDKDGSSEYLINGRTARLMDITESLEKAGFGQSKYTVIGQGVIDQFLLQGPAEIKAIIEEAAGIGPYYSKRDKSLRRLERTYENLEQVQTRVSEIEPRLKTLRRQAKRLEQRAVIESEWSKLFAGRKRHILENLQSGKQQLQENINSLKQQEQELEKTWRGKLDRIENDDEQSLQNSKEIDQLQQELQSLQQKRESLYSRLLQIRAQISSNQGGRMDASILKNQLDGKISEQKNIKVQLAEAKAALAQINTDIEELVNIVQESKPDLVVRFKQLANNLVQTQENLVKNFTNRNTDLESQILSLQDKLEKSSGNTPVDSVNQSEEKELEEKIEELDKLISGKQQEFKNILHSVTGDTGQRQRLSKEIREDEEKLRKLRDQQGDLRVELAKIETRLEDEQEQTQNELGADYLKIIANAEAIADSSIDEHVAKLRRQLEQIGGLDDLTLQEYEETEERYTYLTTQMGDLKKAAADLEKIIKELDEVIKKRFDSAYGVISKKFSEFFTMLFNGGKAELYILETDDDIDSDSDPHTRVQGKKEITGIGVKATPPGKKLSAISSLSGGERTLTSIALLMSLLDAYPSPFVVLDEADAALDESNSIRFAKILEQLAGQTQFITITHNRETMRRAHTLYGVTMSSDGISKLLSIKLEQSLEYAD